RRVHGDSALNTHDWAPSCNANLAPAARLKFRLRTSGGGFEEGSTSARSDQESLVHCDRPARLNQIAFRQTSLSVDYWLKMPGDGFSFRQFGAIDDVAGTWHDCRAKDDDLAQFRIAALNECLAFHVAKDLVGGPIGSFCRREGGHLLQGLPALECLHRLTQFS